MDSTSMPVRTAGRGMRCPAMVDAGTTGGARVRTSSAVSHSAQTTAGDRLLALHTERLAYYNQ